MIRTGKSVLQVFVNLIFFLFLFLFFLFKVDPRLLYHRQDPVFLRDAGFFREFLRYPGGLLEWTGALFAQSWIYPLGGALLVTLTLIAVAGLTRLCLRRFDPGSAVVPAMVLGAMQVRYGHPLSVTLGVITALVFAAAAQRLSRDRVAIRTFGIVVLYSLCYYLAGGFVLLYLYLVLLNLFSDSKPRFGIRDWVPAGTLLVAAAGIPYLLWYDVFQISLTDAWLILLPSGGETPWLLILSLGLGFMLPPLMTALRGAGSGRLLSNDGRRMEIVFQAVWVAAGILLVFFSADAKMKMLLSMDRAARHGDWKEVIRIANDPETDQRNPSVTFLVNQALCFEGLLLENMFRLPQASGLDGLVLLGKAGLSGTLQNSDFYFRMGHLNESRHWAHEALSGKGETPAILERLILVNLMLEDAAAARKFMNVLRKSLIQPPGADQLAAWIEDPAVASLPAELARIKSFAPPEDFIINRYSPIADFKKLIHYSPLNRMAVDYYMAWYLLKGRVGVILRDLAMLRGAGYQQLPRHIQEALVFYMANTSQRDPDLAGYQIDPRIIQRFFHYNQILAKYQGDRRKAVRELAENHGDTFWFYVMYRMPREYSLPANQQETSR